MHISDAGRLVQVTVPTEQNIFLRAVNYVCIYVLIVQLCQTSITHLVTAKWSWADNDVIPLVSVVIRSLVFIVKLLTNRQKKKSCTGFKYCHSIFSIFYFQLNWKKTQFPTFPIMTFDYTQRTCVNELHSAVVFPRRWRKWWWQQKAARVILVPLLVNTVSTVSTISTVRTVSTVSSHCHVESHVKAIDKLWI